MYTVFVPTQKLILILGPKVAGQIDVGGSVKGPELEADLSGSGEGEFLLVIIVVVLMRSVFKSLTLLICIPDNCW